MQFFIIIITANMDNSSNVIDGESIKRQEGGVSDSAIDVSNTLTYIYIAIGIVGLTGNGLVVTIMSLKPSLR